MSSNRNWPRYECGWSARKRTWPRITRRRFWKSSGAGVRQVRVLFRVGSLRRSCLSSSSSFRGCCDPMSTIVFPQPLLTLSLSRSLSLSSNNDNINNRNRTVLPERRVRSRETFVLLGRAPGECCRTITIRRRKRRRASEYEYAKTTRTFNASG